MKFVQLRAYDEYITANLRLQQLEAEGIRCYLQDENTVTIDPILSNAIGGIKLMVYEEQWQRANELLHAIEENYRKSAVCPRCGASDIHLVTNTKKAGNWLSAIVTWLAGSYAVGMSQVYKCFNCGYEMESLPGMQHDSDLPS